MRSSEIKLFCLIILTTIKTSSEKNLRNFTTNSIKFNIVSDLIPQVFKNQKFDKIFYESSSNFHPNIASGSEIKSQVIQIKIINSWNHKLKASNLIFVKFFKSFFASKAELLNDLQENLKGLFCIESFKNLN